MRDTENSTDRGDAPATDVTLPDDEHYQALLDEADNLVIFLGADVNADERAGPFQPGTAMLPDDRDLAGYLADRAKLSPGQWDLAAVAQYAQMIRGEPDLFRWVQQISGVDSEPGPIRQYLASLPGRLAERGLRKRYPMIITPAFDTALEHALRSAGEPFDVAVYMAPGTEYAGRFLHFPWDGDPRTVLTPNRYTDFPVTAAGDMTRTVVVRIHGTADDPALGYRWKSNFVITEDHFIDYFGGRSAEEVVPIQILAKLREASCLFLGYPIADWPLRVFLHWIWPGGMMGGGAMRWAVERNPHSLERGFWGRYGISLYTSSLTGYVQELDRFITEHSGDLT